ncbi:putative F420-0 ABC transporter substrate-binding protein [Cellulomonas endophytica]|uniref:putative F420-0 ABC transporter substrate-binding protein n=1 Tax=Cellulomonas endophytica TaxID=2494735 RepID=UPI001011201F|nr:putative F420-0 ABC transporter substrate-binding protein [Cellulomonas endophytica]
MPARADRTVHPLPAEPSAAAGLRTPAAGPVGRSTDGVTRVRPRRAHRAALPLAAGVLALALAGCASDPAGSTTAGTAASSSPTAGATPGADGHPVTVDNCGTEVTLEAPPQRVVTVKSSVTELVLALGLGDRLVGTAFADGPLPEALAADAVDVPVLSEGVPGQEAVLALAPDLVLGGWESNFSDEGVGEREALAALGIATYVAPSACQEEAYRPDPLTFPVVFDEIREVAALLGVPERAEVLVAEQRAQLADVPQAAPGTTALWYSSGTDTPYVGAGIGAPQMVLDAVGLENVVGDVRETWTSVGWEAVVAADPDVLVLVDATWNTAESKIERLESDPATSQLTAVRERRYVVVPFAASEGGVRNVEAARTVADGLADLGLVDGDGEG